VWDGETPIACFGQVLLWENNGEVWSVFASDIGTRMTYVYRATRRLIASVSTRRLQAYVDAHFEEGVRWMFRLGFMIEGRLDGYFPNGNDAYLFAMTRGAAPVPQVRPFAMVDQYDERDMLAKILRLESEMEKLPQEAPPQPVHHFSRGLYARELTIPKGKVCTGKMHRHDHIMVVTKGEASVLTDEGIVKYKKGDLFFAKAGTKRALYMHEETTFVTVHGTSETDMEALEKDLIMPPEEFLKKLGVEK
jgi:quercetin dioxygenase-like cupin family protein